MLSGREASCYGLMGGGGGSIDLCSRANWYSFVVLPSFQDAIHETLQLSRSTCRYIITGISSTCIYVDSDCFISYKDF